MIDCSKCGKPVDGDICAFCKWQESRHGYSFAPDPEAQRLMRLCAHEVRGQRCAKPGVVSPSTMQGGRDGKDMREWFCWDHVPGLRQFKDGEECAPPMGFAALRAKLKPFDFEAELERRAIQGDVK